MKVEVFSKKWNRVLQKVGDITAVMAFITMIGLIGSMDCDMSVDHSIAIVLLGLGVLLYTVCNADRI